MTDDAFLRAIVGDPTDDLQRLVYADWLDDHGDPRGAYLRAEHEAVVTGDVSDLRRLAVGLDPVWVARVSLPPVGVCCMHLTFSERGPQLSEADVAATEDRLDVRLPADYRAFLLNYNGGRIDLLYQTPQGEPLPTYETDWTFYPAHKLRPPRTPPDEPTGEDAEVAAWLSRFVQVGHDSDRACAILLGVSEPDFGQVRLLDTLPEPVWEYRRYQRGRSADAATFAAFLSHLPKHPVVLNEGNDEE